MRFKLKCLQNCLFSRKQFILIYFLYSFIATSIIFIIKDNKFTDNYLFYIKSTIFFFIQY